MINKRPEIISLTNKALERIKFIMSKAPENTLGIRFGVKPEAVQV